MNLYYCIMKLLNYLKDYHNATTLLDPEDLFSGLVGPYDQKSQGVIMWGSTAELEDAAFIDARHIPMTSCICLSTASLYYSMQRRMLVLLCWNL